MKFEDYVGGVTPYPKLTDEMLRILARRGDEQAKEQLSRNELAETYGTDAVNNIDPPETVDNETLLARILQGDETAKKEWYRRYPAEPNPGTTIL